MSIYYNGELVSGLQSGVMSWNGRTGAVVPEAGDYTAEMVGALAKKVLSQEEYDALSEEEKQADNILYLIDEPSQFVPLSIQEYDTEDGWHVRKWSSGYVEMSKAFSFYKGKETYGPVPDSPFTLPVVLKEKYSEQTGFLQIDKSMSNYISFKSYGADATDELTTTAWIVFESSGAGAGNIKGSVMVTGRWK